MAAAACWSSTQEAATRSPTPTARSRRRPAPPSSASATDCLWDRAFAAPSIDPAAPDDLSIGIPVPVGDRILAANAVVGPDLFLRAQVAAFDALSGARIGFQFYPGVAEIGFYGPGPTQAIARVIGTDRGASTTWPRSIRARWS